MRRLILVAVLVCTACTPHGRNTTPYQSQLLTYSTGFETLDDFFGFYVVPQNDQNSASHDLSLQVVHTGKLAHKGWIYSANAVIPNKNTNHRAYPTIQLYKRYGRPFQPKVRIILWVWLDAPIEDAPDRDWFSVATLTSYADDFWFRSLLVNLHKDGYLQFMHTVNPYQGSDLYQNTTIRFPQRQWVKLTIALNYAPAPDGTLPVATLWQDDLLISRTHFNPRVDPLKVDRALWPACLSNWNQQSIEEGEKLCGLKYVGGLAQAHLGLYAPPLMSSGTVYNDDLSIAEEP